MTGPITNCSLEGKEYTSYVGFSEKYEDDYQALYFSQSKGIFYGIYGKIDLNKNKDSIKGIFLEAVNYQRSLPFTFKIGFENDKILSTKENNLFSIDEKDSRLEFRLVLDKNWKTKEEAYLELENPIALNEINNLNNGFYLKRFFSETDAIKDPMNNTRDSCSENDGTRGFAIGMNCIESELEIIQ